MAMTGLTKSSATTMTALSKNSVVMYGMVKAGQGWQYDQPGITYDGQYDAEGREVLYDGIGHATIMTPQPKNFA